MINKIGNWVFGSFFRTIGRLLVFILLGVIIANLVDFSSIITNFRITDLFFEKVKASTFTSTWISSSDYKIGDNGSWQSSTLSSDKYYQFNSSLNGSQIYFFKFNNGPFDLQNKNMLRFNIKFRLNTIQTYDVTINKPQTSCTINGSYDNPWGYIWDNNMNTTGRYEDIEYIYSSFNCNAQQITGSIDYDEEKFSLTASYWYNDNTGFQTPCFAVSNSGDTYSFECPITSSNINGISLNINTNNLVDFTTGYYYLMSVETDTTQAIIDNQNQNTQQQMEQQQQQHEEIMDDNTTEANSEGQDFINNFSNNSHGLTGIITAPLNAIQSIASATCSPLVLPLPFMSNKSLTLPCMNSIYTQYFGAFYTMYQGIILALISYWVCVRLFTLVKGFKDPEDDKIEVMDL